jgi:DNA-binding beta-propeller fold protein YncE
VALRSPTDVCLLTDGRLFISDTGNQRVVVVHSDGLVETVAECSGPGEATLHMPEGLAADEASECIYVADSGNDRVRIIRFH